VWFGESGAHFGFHINPGNDTDGPTGIRNYFLPQALPPILGKASAELLSELARGNWIKLDLGISTTAHHSPLDQARCLIGEYFGVHKLIWGTEYEN